MTRAARAGAAVFLLLLAACVTKPTLLNSERIEQRFGSYGVDVLEQSSSLRRSNLYSLEGGERICRTYAVAQFHDLPADIAATQAKVRAGQSIGASFKAAGWAVAKRTVYEALHRIYGSPATGASDPAEIARYEALVHSE